jgi:REP element-mobilizing transposase RayT
MPEHAHLLISEPKTANPSKVLQVLKQKVSRELGSKPAPLKTPFETPFEAQGKQGAAPAKPSRPSDPPALSFEFVDSRAQGLHFWQRRFYDFNVWSSGKVREKLEYMHANPVKRKLVQHPKHWPWSSWSHYENGREGLIAIDSASGKENGGRNKGQNPHP